MNILLIPNTNAYLWVQSLPGLGIQSRHALRSAFSTSRDNEPGNPSLKNGCFRMFPTPACLEKHSPKRSISSGDCSALTYTLRPALGIGIIFGCGTRLSDSLDLPEIMRTAKAPRPHRSLWRFSSVNTSGRTLIPNGAGVD